MRKGIFLIVILALIISACSDDSGTNPTDDSYYFEFKEGNEWIYEQIITSNSGKIDTNTFEILVFEESEKKGEQSFKFIEKDIEVEINPDRFQYGRTDEDGYYNYYDELRDNGYPTELFTDVWIKTISFTEETWTALHYELDSTAIESGNKLKVEFDLSGERIEEFELEYKGKTHKAMRIRSTLIDKSSFIVDNEVVYESDNSREIEYTVIKSIGIYKMERKIEDLGVEIQATLTDHKTN